MELSPQEQMVQDLARSGLKVEDIKARTLDDIERNSTNVGAHISGYVLPYYRMTGEPIPFYRVRLFNSEPKYKQVKNTLNHIYFPANFMKTLLTTKSKFIIITEGEKKAALACKQGFPAVALSGVDSWKNRSLILPKETQFTKYTYNKEVIKATIPPQSNAFELESEPNAEGLTLLLDYAREHNLGFILVYDTDSVEGVKHSVQRAAAVFAYELRFLGFEMTQVKQLILPPLQDIEKTGLDDYLMNKEAGGGYDQFKKLYDAVILNPRAFPKHPNTREYVNRKLQSAKMSRKEFQAVGLAVTSEMDARGYRMFSHSEGQMYYFDASTSRLMKVGLNQPGQNSIQETAFGRLLYQDYGISPSADHRLMQWLGMQFSGEEPIGDVSPYRILARPKDKEDIVRFQISDGQYVKISKEGIEFKNNGDDGVLFEAERVQPLSEEKLKAAIEDLRTKPLTMWWQEVLTTARLKERGNEQLLNALLYYISPWFYRWRGTQLPVEIIVGEAGSGKSSLCEARLTIQTGNPKLKNAPNEIKDWHAAIANSGGLHVTDNVQLLNKALRTALSDEICRLITEPFPQVEMRKLYTNTDIASVKVDNVFVFTSISQPFMASDLLQRAIVTHFDKSLTDADAILTYDSEWTARVISSRGGREYWLAHHFLVIEKFFKLLDSTWNSQYRAKHRLINFEQLLVIMARDVFGVDHEWIPEKLAQDVNSIVEQNDWALQGLKEYVEILIRSGRSGASFSAKDVVEWASGNQDYEDCGMLLNSRKLGIYIANSKHMVSKVAGIIEGNKVANRTMFKIDKSFIKKK